MNTQCGYCIGYFLSRKNSLSVMKGVIYYGKKYIVKATKQGKDWKKISTGMEFLDDNKFYRLEFHAKGLIQSIRVKNAFIRNKKFKYYTYKE